MRRNERFSDRAMKAALSTRVLPVGFSSIVGSTTQGKGGSRKAFHEKAFQNSPHAYFVFENAVPETPILKRLS
jgi:hypothetical protein